VPRTPSFPAYRLHKPSGQAVVTVRTSGGRRRDVYLGPHNTPESRTEYARVIAELAAAGPAPPSPSPSGPAPADLTVHELLAAFWRHAEQHYRGADGEPTSELTNYRILLRPVRELYGHTRAAAFGPLALKAVRQRYVDAGLCRPVVNRRVSKVRHVFRWAASEQLVPVAVYQALATVAGLQKGRTTAPDPDPVGPVAEADVRATLPFVGRTIRAMVDVQLLTGMRPGEVCRLRPCEIDTARPVWVFRPSHHKTAHRGKTRVITIGPKAQAVLERFTPADPADYYFSPRRVVAALRAEKAANRKTPRYPSHMARNEAKRKTAAERVAGARYKANSYAIAIARGVDRANARRERLAGAGNFEPVPAWHPNQLRHTHATEVRKRFGLEAAQVALGHERADVTQV
jgi:integrase